MADFLDTALFGDDLSPEDRSSLQDRFEDDPGLAAAWAHWREARHRIREELEERLPDRRLLVLYVLDQEGESEALTPREQRALDEARDDIARAIDAIPALEHVVERIREEHTDFEEVWAAHAAEDDVLAEEAGVAGAPASERDPTGRTDRAARPNRSREASPTRRWSQRLVVAFAVVALAAVAFLLWPQAPSTTTVTVADGSVQVETLEDGSTVRLVGPATLSYPTDEAEARQATLQAGRAFFDVQPRKDASFVVETPTATATVLGTQFGITTDPDTTDVVLATGSVRVAAKEASGSKGVVLKPGQRSRVARSEAPAPPTPVDLTAALDWTGLFVFRSTPLDAIAERIEQRYDVRLAVAPSLEAETVTGTFEHSQTAEEVLETLAATLGAEVRKEGGKYRLTPGS